MSTNIPPFVCPCGCPLQLDRRDYANHIRLLAIVGDVESRGGTNLRSMRTGNPAERAEAAEPMTSVACGKCKSLFPVFAYIADLLKTAAMRIECSLCRSPS